MHSFFVGGTRNEPVNRAKLLPHNEHLSTIAHCFLQVKSRIHILQRKVWKSNQEAMICDLLSTFPRLDLITCVCLKSSSWAGLAVDSTMKWEFVCFLLFFLTNGSAYGGKTTLNEAKNRHRRCVCNCKLARKALECEKGKKKPHTRSAAKKQNKTVWFLSHLHAISVTDCWKTGWGK